MKRVFKFKQGQSWDGDEAIFHFIEEELLDWETNENFPKIKNDVKVTLNLEWKKRTTKERKR